jgi:hypothetical protein
MTVDLFAGIPVSDYAGAAEWYERLFGRPPSFIPNETEAVWELAEHRYIYIEHRPEHAGTLCTPSSSTTSIPSSRRSPAADSSLRSARRTATVYARPRTTIPTATRSSSAARPCNGYARWSGEVWTLGVSNSLGQDSSGLVKPLGIWGPRAFGFVSVRQASSSGRLPVVYSAS